eukprot:CAMPEP_0206543378 /NCGR_PEP_ID=MMETSP0325_2-20121206/10827_1 /ASSEMBLY_ACC=CAM_ASM_000347 /TAXON_ID=2866 /ORGANISM="Crypthecodinium cohnii, Strain Seligo" /LENGTH=1374 /DNA_ID=CAMNT_0054041805 /DNA_START=29 /DNA_END=4152 /DNA_ORIENTATION=-
MAPFERKRSAHGVVASVACILTLASLQAVHGSWSPRPFDGYRSPASNVEGRQRFTHSERHALEDGGDLDLSWEVFTDPTELLALDIHHTTTNGVRLVECSQGHIVLEVPAEYFQSMAKWRHITASEGIHGCAHLVGEDLYHRILGFVSAEPVNRDEASSPRHRVTVATAELASPAEIFPECSFNFAYMPIEAKVPPHELERKRASGELPSPPPGRRLFSLSDLVPDSIQDELSRVDVHMTNKVASDPTTEANTVVPFGNIPTEFNHLAWNYNYQANTTTNPQFRYVFPGGKSWLRMYQPRMTAHLGLVLNFTSKWKSLAEPPHVIVRGELRGFADFFADVAAAVNFNTERSATVLHNILNKVTIPGLGKLNTAESGEISPLKFYLGPAPITVRPRWTCQLKAYHLGTLQGSLRFGLKTVVKLQGLMFFDTDLGLQTNFSAKAVNVSFTPPTWMLFTQNFELGVMLQPQFWLKGGLANMKDMEYGLEMRPYFNVSIKQQGAPPLSAAHMQVREVGIYPYRVYGLPRGKAFKVGLRFNDMTKWTSAQVSGGVVEYLDDPSEFLFGTLGQEDMLGAPIQVAIMEEGVTEPVGIGEVVCSNTVNGICAPSPTEVVLQVQGRKVTVHLTVVWADNAKNILESKMKAVSLRFEKVALVSQPLISELNSAEARHSAEIWIRRNGRVYTLPIHVDDSADSPSLTSPALIELGPQYLENWKQPKNSALPDPELADGLKLVVSGMVVGVGAMPPIEWDSAQQVSPRGSTLNFKVTRIPAAIALYSPSNPQDLVAQVQMNIVVVPAARSAFWVTPYKAATVAPNVEYPIFWTTHAADPTRRNDFRLTASKVKPDGTLEPTSWQQVIRQEGCQTMKSPSLHRYNGGTSQCVFSSKTTFPPTLDGEIVLELQWRDLKLKMPHKMVSVPLIVSGSAIQGARLLEDDSIWGSTQLQNGGGKGEYNEKVKQKLAALEAKACDAKDLEYGIGAGLEMVNHLHNFVFGNAGQVGGLSDAPDWVSEPMDIMDWGSSPEGADLESLLPKSICAGGVCEGIMPGCQKKQTNPIAIKQVVFIISRHFKWKEHAGPQLRHAVAYGLAIMPDILKVAEKEIKAQNALEQEGNGGIFSQTPDTSSAPVFQTPAPPPSQGWYTTTTLRTTPPPTPAPTTTTQALAPNAAPQRSEAEVGDGFGKAGGPPNFVVPPAAPPAPLAPSHEEAEQWPPLPPGFNRRLSSEHAAPMDDWDLSPEDDENPEADGREFNKFTVTIHGPVQYKLTQDLLINLAEAGAFKFEDGREDELGPILVKDVKLVTDEDEGVGEDIDSSAATSSKPTKAGVGQLRPGITAKSTLFGIYVGHSSSWGDDRGGGLSSSTRDLETDRIKIGPRNVPGT